MHRNYLLYEIYRWKLTFKQFSCPPSQRYIIFESKRLTFNGISRWSYRLEYCNACFFSSFGVQRVLNISQKLFFDIYWVQGPSADFCRSYCTSIKPNQLTLVAKAQIWSNLFLHCLTSLGKNSLNPYGMETLIEIITIWKVKNC